MSVKLLTVMIGVWKIQIVFSFLCVMMLIKSIMEDVNFIDKDANLLLCGLLRSLMLILENWMIMNVHAKKQRITSFLTQEKP